MNNRVKRNSIKSSELFDFFWEPWTFIISNLLICFRNFSGVISKKKKLKWNKNTENSSEQLQHFQTKSAQKVFGYLIYICSTINICFIWEWSFQRKKTEAAVQSCSEKKLFCKATLLKSHFSMSVPLYVCCIFSEHLLQRTPLNGCFWNNFLFSKGYFL